MYPRIKLQSIRLKPDYIKANRLGPITKRIAKYKIFATAELMREKWNY
jgi:hypothetical protein